VFLLEDDTNSSAIRIPATQSTEGTHCTFTITHTEHKRSPQLRKSAQEDCIFGLSLDSWSDYARNCAVSLEESNNMSLDEPPLGLADQGGTPTEASSAKRASATFSMGSHSSSDKEALAGVQPGELPQASYALVTSSQSQMNHVDIASGTSYPH
jgi:hypothetical protein